MYTGIHVHVYNYVYLLQQKIARFYLNIVREIRAEPEYFRVGFYGGFPPFLRNKVFIFRGHEYEKLSDFNTRLAVQFTNAKVGEMQDIVIVVDVVYTVVDVVVYIVVVVEYTVHFILPITYHVFNADPLSAFSSS